MIDDEQVEQWVARSCAEQGVPVKITDPMVIRDVATLLSVPPAPAPKKKRRT